jgi:hypothetical protein
MKLALMECGRKLGTYLRKRQKMQRESARRDIFERYIGEVAQAIHDITGEPTKKLYEQLVKEAKKRTAIADAELDEDGKVIKGRKKKGDEADDLRDDEGVVLVEQRAPRVADEATEENEQPASKGKSRNLTVVRPVKGASKPTATEERLFE